MPLCANFGYLWAHDPFALMQIYVLPFLKKVMPLICIDTLILSFLDPGSQNLNGFCLKHMFFNVN